MTRDGEVSAETRALVRVRQQAVPGAGGPPLCPCCGEAILADVNYHHRARKRRGGGDGRPSNIIAVHGRLEGGQCHWRRIHEDVAAARERGWILASNGPQIRYQLSLWDEYRQAWIVLLDEPGEDGLMWELA